jgi:NAD(P)-dependent dehydrogenase (short-subunit alcohol dehydrogenase family)
MDLSQFSLENKVALAIAAHVGRIDQLQPVVDRVVSELGGLDILVNNTGTNFFAPAIAKAGVIMATRALAVECVARATCPRGRASRVRRSEGHRGHRLSRRLRQPRRPAP